MDFYVVILDSNATNIAAFFPATYGLAAVTAWRDANFPSGEIFEAEIDSYRKVLEQTINL